MIKYKFQTEATIDRGMALKIERLFLLLFLLLSLQACFESGPVHVYSGERPRNETAQLRVPGPITVVEIDGKKINVPSQDDGFYEIFLLPGLHRIDFKYELFWGDNTGGLIVDSSVVGIETLFNAGMTYKLIYSVPEDEYDALALANNFTAKLIELKTNRHVTSRSTAELDVRGIKTSIVSSNSHPVSNHRTQGTESTSNGVPPGINVDTATREDAVKRLKFWWLIADEQEQKRFNDWKKSLEGADAIK